MDIGVTATHPNALTALMTYVTIVVVKKMIFQHEDMILDTTISSKSKLYKNNKLLFMGDGYKAITIMLNSSKDNAPVKDKFWAQLSTREKPRFSSKGDDLEALRKEALESFGKPKEEKPNKKSKKTNQWERLTK